MDDESRENMAYMDWNLLSQREAFFKGQNRETLNDQDPLKSKDDHESKRTIPHICGDDFLTHDHNIGAVV